MESTRVLFIAFYVRGKNLCTSISLWDCRFSTFNYMVVMCGTLHVNHQDFSKFEEGLLLLTKGMWTLDD
jgi:hypothetical protein